eukprot:TRINITY_DN35045_c0_g1_i1.p1 TRINITY_DN35045_c0_g1~~TRINITY_DN35045_c0_g1_i1.p1  ORF type:complete len:440 (+),score=84.67 TRINITY_DN35045_c0_g1_i1:48-1367(+)
MLTTSTRRCLNGLRRWMGRSSIESFDELVHRMGSLNSSNSTNGIDLNSVDPLLLQVAGLSDQLVVTKKYLTDRDTAKELQKLCGARTTQTMKTERRSKMSRYVRRILLELVDKGNHVGSATYSTALRLISGYGDKKLLIVTYDEMRKKGIAPNQTHLLYLLQAFHNSKDLKGCAMVFREVHKEGLEPSLDMFRLLISCQAMCDKKHEAKATLDIAKRTFHSSVNISVFTAYAQTVENYSEATRLLDDVKEANLSVNSSFYQTVLTSMLRRDNVTDCNKLLTEILKSCRLSIPKASEYVIRMRCLKKTGDVQKMKDLFKDHSSNNSTLSLYTEYMSALLSACSEKQPTVIDNVREAYDACVLAGYTSTLHHTIYIKALTVYKAVTTAESLYSRLSEDLRNNISILKSLRDCNEAVGNTDRATQLTKEIDSRLSSSDQLPR